MSEPLDPLRLPLWGSRLIEASAGTGKTWTIAAVYLRLVLGHGDADTGFGAALRPAQILVMTFTRAATRELGDRIRARLVDAARCFRGEQPAAPDDALLLQLLAEHPPGPLRQQSAWRLAMAAEAMDEAAVHTIDAWCQRTLREHALATGSLFDEELGADETSLLAEAGRDTWRAQVYPLDGPALAAVLALWTDVHALIADVAGLLRHLPDPPAVAHAIDTPSASGDASAAPLLGDVWRAASLQRRQALQQAKQGWAARVQALQDWLDAQLSRKDSPFNKAKLRSDWLAGWWASLHAWAADPEASQPDWSVPARHRLSPVGLDEARKPAALLDLPDDFAALHALLTTLSRLPEPAHTLRLAAAQDVAARIQALKRRSGSFGFADLVLRLGAALAGPQGEGLRQRILQQTPVALIDEFQDTSPAQYALFDRLYQVAANPRGSALLLIGDPKQSIYAFRGADIRSYLAARRATAGRHYRLETNFRSTTALVAVVNQCFTLAEQRDGPGAFRFRGLSTGESGDDGDPMPFVPVIARGRPERLVTTNGPLPALWLCMDAQGVSASASLRRLAQPCADHIVGLLGDAKAGFEQADGGWRRLRPADIAVLVRTGREADAVRRALRQRRVASVYLSDRDSVLASPEAADLLRWLQAVADPLDSRRVRAALATATLGLPLAELARLGQDDEAFEQQVELLRQLHRVWQRQGVLTLLRQTLHRLGLPARWLQQPDGERRLTNVLHLAELLQAASAQLDGEQALIRWLATELAAGSSGADEQVLRLESDADLVKVVTVHKSKGLEYPVVCLPFACSVRTADRTRQGFVLRPGPGGGRVIDFRPSPEARAAADEERLQEDLRLLYVALTRARHALWLGVAALKQGQSREGLFHRSAFGRLLAGDAPVPETAIAGRLTDAFGGWAEVQIDSCIPAAPRLLPSDLQDLAPLPALPPYQARFERDWGIGSFSALVRDLAAGPPPAPPGGLGPARAEDLLLAPAEPALARPASAPQHRFPRGALAGNFLHDQLEWLAGEGFALATDPAGGRRLAQRCERQGWGRWSADVQAWLAQVLGTPLPPVGVALSGLQQVLPEMEFWLPTRRLPAATLDALCQQHLLPGRPRPPLGERHLHGLVMGFADLVFAHGGRYWVLDYKSNALGDSDAHYHADALAAAMAEHRYDVQAALYLLALHRLLRQRLSAAYQPAQHLGGAVYLFLRGVGGPAAGVCHLQAPLALLDALDAALGSAPETS